MLEFFVGGNVRFMLDFSPRFLCIHNPVGGLGRELCDCNDLLSSVAGQVKFLDHLTSLLLELHVVVCDKTCITKIC